MYFVLFSYVYTLCLYQAEIDGERPLSIHLFTVTRGRENKAVRDFQVLNYPINFEICLQDTVQDSTKFETIAAY